MLMRVTWGKLKSGGWDDYEALWKQYAATTAGVKGLKQRFLLRDQQDSDAGYSLTIWESLDDLNAHMADRPPPGPLAEVWRSGADFDTYLKEQPGPYDMEGLLVGQYFTTLCDLRVAAPPL